MYQNALTRRALYTSIYQKRASQKLYVSLNNSPLLSRNYPEQDTRPKQFDRQVQPNFKELDNFQFSNRPKAQGRNSNLPNLLDKMATSLFPKIQRTYPKKPFIIKGGGCVDPSPL
jgi:hypothetical protein